MPNKLNIQTYCICISGIFMPFFVNTYWAIGFDKMQIPCLVSIDNTWSVYSLFGDDWEFAFLCADFGRRTFFICWRRMYEQKYQKKRKRYNRNRADSRWAFRLPRQRRAGLWMLLRRMWLLFALLPRIRSQKQRKPRINKILMFS